MTRRTPALFFDPATIDHDTGPGHPERPDRLERIRDVITGSFPDIDLQSAEPAERTDLERVHTSSYVDRVLAMRGDSGRLDADTPVSPESVDAALLAAGMSVAAVEKTVDKNKPTFALVRPPGHHAESDQGMGFCIFGNVAVACDRVVAGDNDVDRILIVDWDVHHGNGTQHGFYDRDDVLFFSTHQHPFYPGTGQLEETGAGVGDKTTVNVPLPAGTGDAALVEAFETILVPAARSFDPDLIVVSAGYDSHALDPVGGMQVTTDGFGRLTSIVDQLADDLADGRIALILEGGYHLDALARSVGRCIEVLQTSPGTDVEHPEDEPLEQALKAVEKARRFHHRT